MTTQLYSVRKIAVQAKSTRQAVLRLLKERGFTPKAIGENNQGLYGKDALEYAMKYYSGKAAADIKRKAEAAKLKQARLQEKRDRQARAAAKAAPSKGAAGPAGRGQRKTGATPFYKADADFFRTPAYDKVAAEALGKTWVTVEELAAIRKWSYDATYKALTKVKTRFPRQRGTLSEYPLKEALRALGIRKYPQDVQGAAPSKTAPKASHGTNGTNGTHKAPQGSAPAGSTPKTPGGATSGPTGGAASREVRVPAMAEDDLLQVLQVFGNKLAEISRQLARVEAVVCRESVRV